MIVVESAPLFKFKLSLRWALYKRWLTSNVERAHTYIKWPQMSEYKLPQCQLSPNGDSKL